MKAVDTSVVVAAFAAVEHHATLISLDQRAATTYEAVGVAVEQLAP
jgi:hypothetical protein